MYFLVSNSLDVEAKKEVFEIEIKKHEEKEKALLDQIHEKGLVSRLAVHELPSTHRLKPAKKLVNHINQVNGKYFKHFCICFIFRRSESKIVIPSFWSRVLCRLQNK